MSESLIHVETAGQKTHRIDNTSDFDEIELGDWYWFKHQGDSEKWGGFEEILCCVIDVGSNYAKIEHPCTDGYHWKHRVHFSEWDARCRYESSPQTYFDQWANEEKKSISRINAEIADICARLGVEPTKKRITESQSGGSLSLVSRAVDTNEYKAALIKAKETDLPALFKQIKEHSGELTRWMLASSLSMSAKCGDLKEAIEVINDRIFTVSIYAGLTESVELVREGDPAGMGEKLRLMQGKLFMDEECLLNYSHGGMEFKDICEFDAWLAKPVNFSRILPHARCMVAFQVRRHEKHREGDGTLQTAWINFELAKMDEITFLYIRNGERMYRLNTDIDFGDELFADRDEFDFTEPMMINDSDSNHPTMPIREFNERRKTYLKERLAFKKKRKRWKEQHELFKQWQEANPDAEENDSRIEHEFCSPFPPSWPWHGFDPRHWKPLDDSNVYVDDVNDRIRKQANHYNRIATLIQGLLDRSETLHPHPPVKLWTEKGFESFIELIFDHDRTLYDGPEPPSWEEYKSKCNASIGVGSIVTGQDEFYWASLPRETDRQSYRSHIPYRYTEGNPGPGQIAVIPEWSSRSKKATFRWIQTRYIYRTARYEHSGDTDFNRSISVPVDQLFNISGYKPGDYKRFLNDPRTRRDYYKWAHLLLTAEEYYAGNLDEKTFEKRKPQEQSEATETIAE